MNAVNESSRLELEDLRREVGHAGGWAPGPTVVFVAGLHGNEPAGVIALRRVFRDLEKRQIAVRGEVVGLAGHLEALARNQRYLERDLNRVWSRRRVEEVESGQAPDGPETREQTDLLVRIRRAIEHARGEVNVIDLHTASADTPPFVILGDTLRNREFGRGFPMPVVLGLEEHILGTLMEWVTGLGHLGLAIEAGRHEDPRSVDRHEAAIWISLVLSNAVSSSDVPDFAGHLHRLERASSEIPSLVEVFHRHAIDSGETFVMRPGFKNFDRVRAGAPLATHDGREVTAERDARIFLPLYQKQGQEGYFLARPVDPVWLAVSAFVRRLGLPRIVHWLPGVARHPELRNALVVNTRIARFFAPKLFHLLGYRLESLEGRKLTVRERDRGPAV
ncbi:MAG: succinylglutamate desuccinylase/aspartoacylase family protein [Gemmatimonadetes bacterium]|nr:succinylglutamate desuccinylase/aspartoacylase family protein [Gemmatimonadota bacterium]